MEKQEFLSRYKGVPYVDGRYHHRAQNIPGKVMCAYYDRGGEGVAYHDGDARNSGSGVLNPADGSYLNEFRKSEGVDSSFTKLRRDPPIDDNPYDKIQPPADLLYVAGPRPGNGSTSQSRWPAPETTSPICSTPPIAAELFPST